MILGHFLLAADILLPEKRPDSAGVPSGFISSAGLILLVGLVILIGAIIWAVFIRKPSGETAYAGRTDTNRFGRRRKKKRERRRPHRTRNATLSETGGLPPLRTDLGDGPNTAGDSKKL